MLHSTKVTAERETLVTPIPAAVAARRGLSPGTELFWAEDEQGGYRVYPLTEKSRRVLEAHEAAIAEHRDVFRSLAG